MRGLAESTKELIAYARELLEEDHPQTLRQLHYAIFSRNEIDYQNDQASYKRLSRATTKARRADRQGELCHAQLAGAEAAVQAARVKVEKCEQALDAAEDAGEEAAVDRALDAVCEAEEEKRCLSNQGNHSLEILCRLPPAYLRIPSTWMIDETREPETVSVWTDAQGYIETVKHSYRRDNWQTQDAHVEVWCEKATIMGALRPVAGEWGITLRVSHGFGSTAMEGQIGRLFESIGKKIFVFYLGDHDASGHVIEEDLHRRAEESGGVQFHMERLAIHAEDIRRFNLPPQQIKETDSRAAAFRRRFGQHASTVELDALPAAELRRRVEEAVKCLIDFDLWNRQTEVQEVELACIADFADRMKNLPQIGGAA